MKEETNKEVYRMFGIDPEEFLRSWDEKHRQGLADHIREKVAHAAEHANIGQNPQDLSHLLGHVIAEVVLEVERYNRRALVELIKANNEKIEAALSTRP